MTRSERVSYLFITFVVGLVLFSGLGTPFLTVLFSSLILQLLHPVVKQKWIAIIILAVVNCVIFYGFIYFIRQAVSTVPHVISESLPTIVDWAHAHDIHFIGPDETDDDIKALAGRAFKEHFGYVTNYAFIATKEFVLMIISLVVAASLFINSELDLDRNRYPKKNNVYSAVCAHISQRFATFYESFATVMGAQLVISSINTSATALFLITVGMPHAFVVIVVTFLCGLLPIIGNLCSNSIIFSIAMTISVKLAGASLIFLIVLHKFEYFLNSKIIGGRIRNPMWLTLLGLMVGEKLAGIPGMILAPVILNYIKLEASKIETDEPNVCDELIIPAGAV